jgi:hypothetical protein
MARTAHHSDDHHNKSSRCERLGLLPLIQIPKIPAIELRALA